MSVTTRKMWDEMMTRVKEQGEELSVIKAAMFEGTVPGEVSADDETFALYFEEMAKKDPTWVMALPFVTGGTAWLSRYERVRGLN